MLCERDVVAVEKLVFEDSYCNGGTEYCRNSGDCRVECNNGGAGENSSLQFEFPDMAECTVFGAMLSKTNVTVGEVDCWREGCCSGATGYCCCSGERSVDYCDSGAWWDTPFSFVPPNVSRVHYIWCCVAMINIS